MGFRLHNATTHKIEHGNGYFNHKQEAINELIKELCPYTWFDGDDSTFSCHIEIDSEELKSAIEKVKQDRKHYDELLARRGIDYDSEELIDIMQEWLTTSDTSSGWIHLYWF